MYAATDCANGAPIVGPGRRAGRYPLAPARPTSTENYIPPAGIEFVRRQQLDVDAMFSQPALRAQELGIDAPQTAFLAALLQRLNPAASF